MKTTFIWVLVDNLTTGIYNSQDDRALSDIFRGKKKENVKLSA